MISIVYLIMFFFFSSRRRHTRFDCDWSSDVCSSDLDPFAIGRRRVLHGVVAADVLDFVAPGQRSAGRRQADAEQQDRKSVVQGKSVDLGGRRIIIKKTKKKTR